MSDDQKTNSIQNKSVIKIDKVDELDHFHAVSKDKEWVGGLNEFAVLGVAAVAYANTLAYKLECKRLDAELQRIEAQRKFAEHVVDKAFKLKMRELDDRKDHLTKFYATLNKQSEQLHIERITVLKMAERAAKKALDEKIDFESRLLYKDMAIEITKQIPLFGDKANESLKRLVDALPKVSIQNGLLTTDQ